MPVITEDLLVRYHPDTVDIEVFHSKVVGTSFRKNAAGEPLDLSFVQDGDFVLIEAEIGNPHDEFACRVVHNETETHMGYLPRETARDVHDGSTRKGFLYIGRVTVTGKDKANRGYNLQIRCLKPKTSDG